MVCGVVAHNDLEVQGKLPKVPRVGYLLLFPAASLGKTLFGLDGTHTCVVAKQCRTLLSCQALVVLLTMSRV